MNNDELRTIYNASGTATLAFDNNWLSLYGPVRYTNTDEYLNGIYNAIEYEIGEYIDKDQKIRDLEAKVKRYEAILKEEI